MIKMKKKRAINDFNNVISQETVSMTRLDLHYFLSDWEDNKLKMSKDNFIDLIFHGKKGTFL